MRPGTEFAPEGTIYVCLACGKTSKTRYGFDEQNKRTSMPGWDESCMMNCDLFKIKDLVLSPTSGRVQGLRDGAKPIVD
jgi:hypothetical protein